MNNVPPLASRWRRLFATLIDAILVPFVTIIIVMLTNVMEDAEDYQDSFWMLHVLLLAIASYLLLNGYWLYKSGQTIGKKLLKIQIVSIGNLETPAPFWRLICVRALFFPLLFLAIAPPLTLIPLLDQLFIFRRNRRCLHDLVSGTVVVQSNPRVEA